MIAQNQKPTIRPVVLAEISVAIRMIGAKIAALVDNLIAEGGSDNLVVEGGSDNLATEGGGSLVLVKQGTNTGIVKEGVTDDITKEGHA